MAAVDRRLLREAAGTRGFLAAAAGVGTAAGLAVVAQAWVLAGVVDDGFRWAAGAAAAGAGPAGSGGPGAGHVSASASFSASVSASASPSASGPVPDWVPGSVPGSAPWTTSLFWQLAALVALTGTRALLAWLTELAAFRSSAAVKSGLRLRLLRHAVSLGPFWLTEQRSAELVTLATRGVDALDAYFARYLPQVVLSVTVPVAVLCVVFPADWVSGATILVTLPLIPVFGALIGLATRAHVDRERRALTVLAGHFLDVVTGLPTLAVFGRARSQTATIRRVTDDYRRATLRTLRVAFLSSFALELAATVSVALVAVGIGLRLVDGSMDLRTALLVLILAPEAYLPLRLLGGYFHASAEGVGAAREVFSVLETPVVAAAAIPSQPSPGASPEPSRDPLPEPSRDPSSGPSSAVSPLAVAVDHLTVRYPGRDVPALADLTLHVTTGECVAVVGPSGAGKSTLLAALLGFAPADAGRVHLPATRARLTWIPQRPHLFAGTIAANVRLTHPTATDAEVEAALRAASAWEFVQARPGGTAAMLGDAGAGLSAGERQRLALARAHLSPHPILLLDEPTANLDPATEAAIVASVRELARTRTVVLVAHRPALAAVADRVVYLAPPPVEADGPTSPDPQPQLSRPTHHEGADPLLKDGNPDSTPPPAAGQPISTQVAPPGRPERRPRVVEACDRTLLATALAALALLSTTALTATAAYLITRAAQHPPILALMVAMTAVRAFGLARAAFRYAERLVAHDAAFRRLAEVRVRVYQALASRVRASQRRGDLLSRLVADVDALQDRYLRVLIPVGAAIGTSVAVVVGLGAVAGVAVATVLAAGMAATGLVIPAVAARISHHAERALAPARADLAVGVLDLLDGAAELLAAGPDATEAALARVARQDSRLTRGEQRSAVAAGVGAALTALAVGGTVAGIALLGTVAVHRGTLTGVWLAVAVLTPLAAFEATAGMADAARALPRIRSAARRVAEVVDDGPDAGSSGQRTFQPLPTPPYRLDVTDLAITWPSGENGDSGANGDSGENGDMGIAALHPLSLTLHPHRRVALVGPSGSGKTTLLNALLRFVEPTAGRVTLNGVDTRDLDPEQLRTVVGLCAQDAHLFDSTLRENLRLARPDATDADLHAVLGRARLADWVATLPRGLDTFVGEHGTRLSGGQRQRLALARALLAGFPILLLDEPAEHLDVTMADALTAELLGAPNVGLIVTHRLAGLAGVDEIVVLDAGRVVERGTFADLLAADGRFAELWRWEREAEELVSRT